eukprot:2661820-Rhodomonas_salina.1
MVVVMGVENQKPWRAESNTCSPELHVGVLTLASASQAQYASAERTSGPTSNHLAGYASALVCITNVLVRAVHCLVADVGGSAPRSWWMTALERSGCA